ncbi:hypothetical protein LCGC14_1724870, partial [marine sediment metagenome]
CLNCRSVGAPHVLCDGCLHNQRGIAELHCRWEEARRDSKEAAAYKAAAEVGRKLVVGGRAWTGDQQVAGEVADDVTRRLGEPTPVKRWVVRLLVRRLELIQTHSGSLGLLVDPAPTTRRGSKPLTLSV